MSNGEANKMTRMLAGERLRFTIRVHVGKEVLEFQSNKTPDVKYNGETRTLWLMGYAGQYECYPIMSWPEGAVMLCEQNPEWVEKS